MNKLILCNNFKRKLMWKCLPANDLMNQQTIREIFLRNHVLQEPFRISTLLTNLNENLDCSHLPRNSLIRIPFVSKQISYLAH